jgi:hypothetical protein
MRQQGSGANWWQRPGGSEWGHTANMSAPRGTCSGLLNTLPPAWLGVAENQGPGGWVCQV